MVVIERSSIKALKRAPFIRADAQVTLVEAIARARRWTDEIVSGMIDSVEAIDTREGRSQRSIRMTLSLAFLAPDIVRAAVDGALLRGIGLSRLADLPIDWAEQHKMLRPLSTHAASSSR